ncbi:MAG: exodeoxyribonuclease III [Deltaproteobacteria bacterium]|nr:exodeoxyribonuclease III [Deltaproteobacteria bacterium]
MKIVSWNVNGLRAVSQRGDLAWAFDGSLDVIGLQETKIQPGHVTEALRAPTGYSFSTWDFHATKKGYSGTALFVRDGLAAAPFAFSVGGDADPDFDVEGRVTGVDLGALVVLNVYFPNGGSSDERLRFKHRWHDAFLTRLVALARTRDVVVIGDFNVAHRALDVALPAQWAGVSGFLPEERAWFDRLLAEGFVDTFRAEKGDLPRQFTFWETRLNARAENQGWRIDYAVINRGLEERLLDAWISPQIRGSDHCPVGVELDVPVPRTAAAPAADADDDLAAGDVDEDDDGAHRRRR